MILLGIENLIFVIKNIKFKLCLSINLKYLMHYYNYYNFEKIDNTEYSINYYKTKN